MGAPNNYLFLKVGALQPVFTVNLQNPDGSPLDLTLATGAKFRMRTEESASLKVSNASAVIGTPKTNGQIIYAWAGTDTDTAGRYLAEVEVDYASGSPLVMPPNGYYHVIVQPILP